MATDKTNYASFNRRIIYVLKSLSSDLLQIYDFIHCSRIESYDKYFEVKIAVVYYQLTIVHEQEQVYFQFKPV